MTGSKINATGSAAKGKKKQNLDAEDREIVIAPSPSAKNTSSAAKRRKKRRRKDDDVELLFEEKCAPGEIIINKRNKKKRGSKAKTAEAEAEKERSDVSKQLIVGKKEELKEVEAEAEAKAKMKTLPTVDVSQRHSNGKEDNKLKGKEVEAKSPEKNEKGNGVLKRQNEGKKEDNKELKGKEVEAKSPEKGNGVLNGGKKEDNKRKRKELEAMVKAEAVSEEEEEEEEDEEEEKRNGASKRPSKGSKEDKEQKKKVAASKEKTKDLSKGQSEGKKEDRKQKNKELAVVEMEEDEEESEKSDSALYKFPMRRISRIIKSEVIDNKISQEAIFLINKASEKFVELFSREAYACAYLEKKSYVAYDHLSSVVSKRRKFEFLSGTVFDKGNRLENAQATEEQKANDPSSWQHTLVGPEASPGLERPRAENDGDTSQYQHSLLELAIPISSAPAADQENQEEANIPSLAMETLANVPYTTLAKNMVISDTTTSRNDRRIAELETEVSRLSMAEKEATRRAEKAEAESSYNRIIATDALRRAEIAEKMVHDLRIRTSPSQNYACGDFIACYIHNKQYQ